MSKATGIVLGALMVGLLVGGGVIAGASTAPDRDPVPTAAEGEPFETNAYGDTIGEYKFNGPRPDLVPATTDDGRPGYFLLDEWVPEMTVDGVPLDEAKATKVPDKNGDIKIPVYARDGRTVIGEATIARVGQGVDINAE